MSALQKEIKQIKSPVLYLVFNRPEATIKTFQSIRKARPSRLYVAADGPRPDQPGEDKLCESVRQAVNALDWPCELKTLFQDKNLGCKNAVSSAITWFFEQEAEGIILEDDVLPDPSFFRYCDELLDRFRDEDQIMMISGDCFPGKNIRMEESYFFSRYAHIWGWATWRRAWEKYDLNLSKWPQLKEENWLHRLGDKRKDFQEYWTRIFDQVYRGKINTWDYQWLFACWVNGGLTVLPSRHLVKNIGFGEDGTHTKKDGGWVQRLKSHSMEFPLKHPREIKRNIKADRWEDLNLFETHRPWYKKILSKLFP